jgi:hypothetical protein
MALTRDIKEHMEVIGADGVRIGAVDKIEGDRIKLTRKDNPSGKHRYLPLSLVADVEGDRVRLSTTGANSFMFQDEDDQGSANLVTSGEAKPYEGSASTASSPSPQPRPSPSPQPKSSTKSSSLPSWVVPTLGTAALTAGAAYFARNRKTETQKFEASLQTDESIRLISSKKVEGTAVFSRDGERLGKIDSFMVDKYSGRVAYAVLSFGGTLGHGDSLFPLPWSSLTYDEGKDGYALNISAEDLARAPKFQPSEAPEFDANYRRGVHQAYGLVVIRR